MEKNTVKFKKDDGNVLDQLFYLELDEKIEIVSNQGNYIEVRVL